MKSRFPSASVSLIVAFVSLPVFAQQDKNFWMENDRASVLLPTAFVHPGFYRIGPACWQTSRFDPDQWLTAAPFRSYAWRVDLR